MRFNTLELGVVGQLLHKGNWIDRYDFLIDGVSLKESLEQVWKEELKLNSILTIPNSDFQALVSRRLLGQSIAPSDNNLNLDPERFELIFQRDLFPFFVCPVCADILCESAYGTVSQDEEAFVWGFEDCLFRFEGAAYRALISRSR